tara:strand:+ start:75 stop:542 length:468 start_codon:yes stop_codon:yes gene_type:complete
MNKLIIIILIIAFSANTNANKSELVIPNDVKKATDIIASTVNSKSYKENNEKVQFIANCVAVDHLKMSRGAELTTQDSFIYGLDVGRYVEAKGLEVNLLEKVYSHTLSHNYGIMWILFRQSGTKLKQDELIAKLMSVHGANIDCSKYPANKALIH